MKSGVFCSKKTVKHRTTITITQLMSKMLIGLLTKNETEKQLQVM